MKNPQAKVYNMDGEIVRHEALDPYVFAAPINTGVLHQVVTVQLLNRRQGTASTKTRGEVSGGNKKPYRQKGTGRARQGSTRAPHFRGGGTVFGPRPHPYEAKVPRKMRRLAIRSALSDKVANNRLLLIDDLTFEAPSTKGMKAFLEKLPVERNVLLLMPERDENVVRSARNLHEIKMGHVASLNVVELLKYDHLLLPLASVERIVAVFGRDADDALDGRRHPGLLARRIRDRAANAARAADGRGDALPAREVEPTGGKAAAGKATESKATGRKVAGGTTASDEATRAADDKPAPRRGRTQRAQEE
jgi:large subunit ribosomal protein L4